MRCASPRRTSKSIELATMRYRLSMKASGLGVREGGGVEEGQGVEEAGGVNEEGCKGTELTLKGQSGSGRGVRRVSVT